MIAVLAFTLAAAAAGPDLPWHEHYRRGVTRFEQGRHEDAAAALARALRLRPQEGLRVRTTGLYYVDYVPHVYLAAAAYGRGDVAGARKHLAAARASGVAARSESGSVLLARYEGLLGRLAARNGAPPAPPEVPAAKADSPGYAVYPRRPTVLSDKDVERLKTEVLGRCHLPTGSERGAPWYFHYEMALELVRHKDFQRALDFFVEAANRRRDPQRGARIYGVWFIDYLPYFNIAVAHSRLGNWECAADAVRVSERMGEIRRGDRRYDELRDLKKDIGLHVKN